jgi:hypothetical protein
VNIASPNNSQDTLKQTIAVDSTLLEQNDQVEDTDIPDGDDSSEGFTCYDGNVIPMEYVNDGECDCGGCEDEGE